jgi:hypothetical protein
VRTRLWTALGELARSTITPTQNGTDGPAAVARPAAATKGMMPDGSSSWIAWVSDAVHAAEVGGRVRIVVTTPADDDAAQAREDDDENEDDDDDLVAAVPGLRAAVHAAVRTLSARQAAEANADPATLAQRRSFELLLRHLDLLLADATETVVTATQVRVGVCASTSVGAGRLTR